MVRRCKKVATPKAVFPYKCWALPTLCLNLISGCALTMTNTLDTVGEREQTGQLLFEGHEQSLSIPTTVYEFDVENNFFYTPMLTTSIQKLEKEPGGNVQIPLEGLKSTWTEVSGTLDGQKALFQARKSHTEKGYKIELRREYSEWYAYPFDVMATAITPFDAAKNFTITYSGLILYGIIHPLFSPFFDVSFPIVLLNPTGY